MSALPSLNVQTKAIRLATNFRVVMVNATKALVIGDHGTYDVQDFGHGWRCNCPWGQMGFRRGECSHVTAVRMQTPETQAVVAPLAAVIKAGLAKMQADAQAQLAADEAELDALFSFK